MKLNNTTPEAILEYASEGILIVNSEGLIGYVNKRVEKLFGYQSEELIGKNVDMLLPPGLRQLHTKHRLDYMKSPYARPMGRGLELHAYRKDGSKLQVEISLSYVQTDTETLIVAFIIDITERKQSEEMLKLERDRAQQYLDVAEVILLVLDEFGRVALINKKGCDILGYEEKEILHKDWFESFLPERTKEEFKEMFKNLISGKVAPLEFFENSIVTKSGEEKIITWHRKVLKDSNGKITGTLSSGEDITDRKRAEEESKSHQRKLMQADKMATLGILVSGVAHEINNPNNFILLNGNILAKVWKDAVPILNEYYKNKGDFVMAGMPYSKAREKLGKLIEGVSEGALRIQKIVQNLKDFARENTGDLIEDVDLNKVVDFSMIIVNNLIAKSTNHFSVNCEDNIPLVRGNFQNLEQVVINLITNSCQALTDKEQGIFISTNYDKDGKTVSLIVQDEGSGIPKENLERIMDPFFTTKREAGGTGLGLSISYNIVKDHGGEMKISSKLDEGTTVVITFPVKEK